MNLNYATWVQQTILPLGNLIVALLETIALLIFFYGIAKYLYAAGSEEDSAEGRSIMLWGLISMFVIVCVWGIVILIKNSLFG